jgi:methylisocitrate lyase
VVRAVDVPVLANMTEFGKSALFTVRELADAGVRMIIYPVTLLRLAMGIVERGLGVLATQGTQASLVPEMQTRARLYELLDYAAYNAFDDLVYTYRPDGTEE